MNAPDILYADNHVVAANKPAGLLSQDSGTGRDNMEDRVRAWIKVERNKPGNVFLHAVHRIDTVVSGLVLFACTSKALSRLNEDVRARRFVKKYHAVVEGQMPAAEDLLEHHLLHGDGRADIAKPGTPGAKPARLRYTVLRSEDKLQWLEIELETGRYHQIRAQLAACGCPIRGDAKYGAKTRLPDGVISLHHVRLACFHPTTKEPLEIVAPYPVGWDG